MNVLPQNPDVIVIGAGAAGLSAAKALMNAGKTVTVLEAAARIGGRCITDTFANKPFDRGCSWLHSADINPLSKLAEEHGFKLHKKHWTYKKFMTGDRMLSDAELEAFKAYEDAMWDAVHEGVEKTGENSIEDLLPASPWRDGAKQWIPQLMSVDADASSAQDLVNHNDTYQDWLVEGGLGTLVAELHRDVPVTLNCRVLEIDTTGKDVRVVTSQGLVCAQKVVLTVSTGVLAADSIRFTPNLPDKKMTAISGLPCGLLNKIGLDFDPEWKEVHEGYMAGYQKNGEEFCTLLFGFFNTSLAIGFTAGRFGQALEKEGLGAATDFCLEGIKAMFGSEAVKYVRETTETAWMANELTFGSYSAALPGCSEARKVLAEPIDDRLYFAGEATMPQDFATVHGAYQSGIRVAEEICSASK